MKAIALLVVLALSFAAASRLRAEEYETLFGKFVEEHGKNYEAKHFFHRFATFKENLDKILAHNQGNHSFTLGMNKFGDMNSVEFKAKMTGYKHIDREYLRSLNTDDLSNVKVAAAVDWNKFLPPVKDQGQCGSCWAFSAVAGIEGAFNKKHTERVMSLSEQQLVDCSTAQGNQGCNGGLMDQAFQYVISNKGITDEASYPYTAKDGTCKSGVAAKATILSFSDVTANDESDLLRAANLGVVSVAIEADQMAFQFYSGGVLDDTSCGTNLDHGVAVVGYGTDAGKDYWTVRNSWGGAWGEKGHIRLVRNKNMCGISMAASYVTAN